MNAILSLSLFLSACPLVQERKGYAILPHLCSFLPATDLQAVQQAEMIELVSDWEREKEDKEGVGEGEEE